MCVKHNPSDPPSQSPRAHSKFESHQVAVNHTPLYGLEDDMRQDLKKASALIAYLGPGCDLPFKTVDLSSWQFCGSSVDKIAFTLDAGYLWAHRVAKVCSAIIHKQLLRVDFEINFRWLNCGSRRIVFLFCGENGISWFLNTLRIFRYTRKNSWVLRTVDQAAMRFL